ncbi:MAG: TIGR00366 family protein, partial [Myxococcales bacterium]|nr:TIGR00366 family protein [Myxococcales bacterium]
LLLAIPALFYWMTPRDPAALIPPPAEALTPLPAPVQARADSIPAWLGESSALARLVGFLGLLGVLSAWLQGLIRFDLNLVNLFFLFLGIASQGGLRAYTEAVTEGARGAGAIVLQFPFYFGILGLMRESGMVAWISSAMASVADSTTFPLLTFLSAGLVNLFVPSGGGQWAVQGEIVLGAGAQLGVDPATTVMAFSYGDAWTNMLQPFWALPLLGIMRLEAKQIVGYSALVLLWMGMIVPALLLLLG